MNRKTVFGKSVNADRWRALLLLIALVSLSADMVVAQKTESQKNYAVSLREISRSIYRRAGQFVEDMRFDSAAANWKTARFGERVFELYRPDIEGVAYYEFTLINAEGENVGFLTVSNGQHEQPIANWSDKNNSPVLRLVEEVEGRGSVAARIYKLGETSYVVEDENGRMAARTKELPLKIVGQQMEWLDRPVEPASTSR